MLCRRDAVTCASGRREPRRAAAKAAATIVAPPLPSSKPESVEKPPPRPRGRPRKHPILQPGESAPPAPLPAAAPPRQRTQPTPLEEADDELALPEGGLVKGAWNSGEDELLVELVALYGAKKWSVIANKMPGRIGKQVRGCCAPLGGRSRGCRVREHGTSNAPAPRASQAP